MKETSNQQPVSERRACAGKAELRKRDDNTPEVFGYALKYDVAYDMGWFTESIQRGSLDNADLSDVRILFNHDKNQVLGRTKSGTAEVGLDDVGMWYRCSLPASPVGETVRVALERGDIDQSSWAFFTRQTPSGGGDTWTRRNGKDHRTITDVRLVQDASPVTYPANPDTTAAKRSYETTEQPTDEARKRELELIAAELQCI